VGLFSRILGRGRSSLDGFSRTGGSRFTGTQAAGPVGALKFAGTPGIKPASGGSGPVGPANHEPGAGNSRISHANASPLDRLWSLQARWDLMERALGTLGQITVPTAVHGISVSVVGGPGADLRRCWYLALAAAFGRYRRSTARGAYSLQMKATWDITGKAVGLTLVYATTTATGAFALPILRGGAGAAIGAALVGLGQTVEGARIAQGMAEYLQRGPDQWTQGGDWPSVLLTPTQAWTRLRGSARGPGSTHPTWAVTDGADERNTRYRHFTTPNEIGPIDREVQGGADNPLIENPKLPFGRTNPETLAGNNTSETDVTTNDPPQLPDYNRIITTGYKLDPIVQPPKPAVDGLSRGSTVQLVTAALGRAGQWPPAPGELVPVVGSSGTFVGENGAAVPTASEVNPRGESNDGLNLPNADGTVLPRVLR
jgi:hypothetical protein